MVEGSPRGGVRVPGLDGGAAERPRRERIASRSSTRRAAWTRSRWASSSSTWTTRPRSSGATRASSRPGGTMVVVVPNARALHRRFGHAAGLLDDLFRLSPDDLLLGHKRYFDLASITELVRAASLEVVRVEGVYLKPLTTAQLGALALPPEVRRAFFTRGRRVSRPVQRDLPGSGALSGARDADRPGGVRRRVPGVGHPLRAARARRRARGGPRSPSRQPRPLPRRRLPRRASRGRRPRVRGGARADRRRRKRRPGAAVHGLRARGACRAPFPRCGAAAWRWRCRRRRCCASPPTSGSFIPRWRRGAFPFSRSSTRGRRTPRSPSSESPPRDGGAAASWSSSRPRSSRASGRRGWARTTSGSTGSSPCRELSVDFAIDFEGRASEPGVRLRVRTSGGYAVVTDTAESEDVTRWAMRFIDLAREMGGRGAFNLQFLEHVRRRLPLGRERPLRHFGRALAGNRPRPDPAPVPVGGPVGLSAAAERAAAHGPRSRRDLRRRHPGTRRVRPAGARLRPRRHARAAQAVDPRQARPALGRGERRPPREGDLSRRGAAHRGGGATEHAVRPDGGALRLAGRADRAPDRRLPRDRATPLRALPGRPPRPRHAAREALPPRPAHRQPARVAAAEAGGGRTRPLVR